ncbi:SURF1 family protein [Bordetella sp. 02P26C-1]|uniref:SURF1 family protein n=1 Tax=Bordetella sp. 02P26C-1 TaxID=2683195 RepID=UPI00135561B2|nr:SURF1 family protein [Bordetella sp. 02P26C-1]MVW78455.1 SURF1 family protein [Bordetella sp. 02P26C-1]
MAHSVRRILLTLVLLGLVVALCVSLGAWQLRRADERLATAERIEAGRAQTPVVLRASTPDTELTAWRPARVAGQWLNQFTILLDNRNQHGKPGYWLATPMLLAGRDEVAVLVLRGWLPRTLGANAGVRQLPDLPPTPDGVQTIVGEMYPHVPRLFELWSLGSDKQGQLPATLPAADGIPQLQNLELADYSKATGLRLLPVVLMQTEGEDALVRDWPQPSVDYHQNRGYALQWFSFAAIAAIAALVLAWRTWRRP